VQRPAECGVGFRVASCGRKTRRVRSAETCLGNTGFARKQVEIPQRLREAALTKQITGKRGRQRVRGIDDAVKRLTEACFRFGKTAQLVERESQACAKLRVRRRANERRAKMIGCCGKIATLAFDVAE